ncbi:MAG: hypothetical protein GY861_22975, partial [bacterium]|nr:hypothetical protein [bacterium]
MLRKTIKKMMALGTGATMVGATLLSATAAADLANYPAPFVKDGAFNAFLVVGDQAEVNDVIGSIDIATSMQYSAKVQKSVATGAGTSVTMTGDSKKIEEATNNFEFSEAVNSITSSVTGADLAALEDGSISNEYGTFKYTQVLGLPTATIVYAKDSSNSADVHDDETPEAYLKLLQSPQAAYNYTISFTPALKSDHDAAGSSFLNDLRGKKITLLGKEYSILRADHSATNSVSLTFMAGSVSDTLDEGETKTYTLNGKDYEVKLDYVGSSDCKFTVEGEVTDPALAETETYRLADGTEIGVVDIMAQEFAGGVRRVQFDLGADKIVLADTSTQTEGVGGAVTIGSEDSSSVKVDIITSADGGTAAGADVKISSIKVWYEPSEDLYVGAGESAAAIADAVESESGVFFLNAFDYKYEGLTEDNPEEVKFVSDGANNYRLQFKNKAGVDYNEYILAMNSTAGWVDSDYNFRLGRWTGTALKALVIGEATEIRDEEFFLINKNKYSRIMQFKSITTGSNATDNEGVLKVKDVGSGKQFEVSYASLTGNLIVDGNTFQVSLSSEESNGTIQVDMNGDGDYGDTPATIYTSNEAYITLPDLATHNNGTGGGDTQMSTKTFSPPQFAITTPEDEDDQRNVVYVNFTANTDNEADITDVTGTATS